MFTLITFATKWGSQHGGINSFNTDLLSAFAFAYGQKVKVVCFVTTNEDDNSFAASRVNVDLVALPYESRSQILGSEHGRAAIDELARRNIKYEPSTTIWLGHDRITGEAAVAAAKLGGGRSAVIHHMSYVDYEPYAENSQSAQIKIRAQTTLLQSADLIFAVGPLLRDAAEDLVRGSKSVNMLVPGLAEISSRDAPNTFTAFMSGRFAADTARLKQGQLGIAGFATAWKEARLDHRPEALRKRPRLVLRGVDFEGGLIGNSSRCKEDVEAELKQFGEKYADAAINIQALPYTIDRRQLYEELSMASVVLMPSWHEGFGLVAWEAIAAGVPLILSEQSGVYQFLAQEFAGAGTGCVFGVDISGAEAEPFFNDHDLRTVVEKLKDIADNPQRARRQARILRNIVGEFSWPSCADQIAKAFGWELERGHLKALTIGSQAAEHTEIRTTVEQSQLPLLKMPHRQWRADAGMADSQLLRAEEMLLPFDEAREPIIDDLNNWFDKTEFKIAIRLFTGPGGQGKTRLALELCQRRLALGWSAGFLDSSVEESQIATSWTTLKDHNNRFLIVVDYAETRQDALIALVKAILRSPGERMVRILLLARDSGDWWDNLPSRDSECELLLGGDATDGPFRLSALYASEHNRRLGFRKALQEFSKTLGVAAPGLDVDLTGEHFGRPLYVQMAALLALYGERPVTAEGLSKGLLNHERRYWVRLLEHFQWTDPGLIAEQLLTLATLAGGFPRPKDARRYWDESGLIEIGIAEFNSLFRELSTLYPGTQGLEALRPDLLGESLVAQALLRPQSEGLFDAVVTSSASQRIRRSAFTVLARLSTHRLDLGETLVEGLTRLPSQAWQDLMVVSTETLGRLPEFAEEAFTRLPSGTKGTVAGSLVSNLQDESVQLARFSCVIHEFVTERKRSKYESKPNNIAFMAEYADVLIKYSLQLSYTGQYESASVVALKSVELFRHLVNRNQSRYEPYYGYALDVCARHLSDSGKSDEGLEYAAEGLRINKRLMKSDKNRYLMNYLMSLTNYSKHLANSGQHKNALDCSSEAREAIKLSGLDRLHPDNAVSLTNHAMRLTDVGRTEEALEIAREALEIYLELAKTKPDRFETAYANFLIAYACQLSHAGQKQQALKESQKALPILERLAQKNLGRLAEHLLNAQNLLAFLAWLNDMKPTPNRFNVEDLLPFVSSQIKPGVVLYGSFVRACLSIDDRERLALFRQVVASDTELTSGQKTTFEDARLCAAAWCSRFSSGDKQRDWKAEWKEYVERRTGRIPESMLEVAKRLGFEWPVVA